MSARLLLQRRVSVAGRRRLVLVALALLACGTPAARAQDSGAARRLSVGGEVTASAAPRDEGFFNYTDYDHTTVRLFTAALGASFLVTDTVALVGELRVENADTLLASALYVRWRPWRVRQIDVQAGRIPPIFGLHARQRYGTDNPLIGLPLAYQSLTTLRSDAVPETAAALLAVRGRGWRLAYPHGPVTGPAPKYDPRLAASYGRGIPLISASRWDTGVQVRVASGPLEAAGAVTVGTLSHPRIGDDNDGKQLVGRVTWRPVPAVAVGGSLSRGAFLSDDAFSDRARPTDTAAYIQRAAGIDVELSADYWIARAELVRSSWRLPDDLDAAFERPLAATAFSVEGRYRLRPGFYVAARAGRLGFSSLPASFGGSARLSWDAPVTRLEGGVGYALTRHVLVKAVYQYNRRDADRPRRTGSFPAIQASVWF